MTHLQSISPITKVFETTGSHPVKVLCSDINEYVCKYSTHHPASGLFNEYIAAAFLKIWGLKVPDFNIVNIKAEHITEQFRSSRIQTRYFEVPCFGSKHIDFGKEIDSSITVISNDAKIIKKINAKHDLLAIALFDLWMANEDRNHNNYNLLLNTDPEYYFVPIDHEKCFNSGSLATHRQLVMLTEDETLINTELATFLFKSQKGLPNRIDEMVANYYLWVAECQKSLENTIDAMPDQWGIAKADKIALLNLSLFNPQWIAECEITFRDYTTRFLLQ